MNTSRRRRDWFRIIRDLMASGVSMGEIGRKTQRDKTTVQKWAGGNEPKESDARMVLALYAKHCPTLYLAHQKEFDIRVEIENVTSPGETRVLPFV